MGKNKITDHLSEVDKKKIQILGQNISTLVDRSDDLSSHEFKYQNPKKEAEQLENLVQNIASNANDLQEVKPFSYKQPSPTKKRKNFFSRLFTNI